MYLSNRAKHSVEVHFWAGISRPGKTSICILEGIMDASFYIQVLEVTLLPFISSAYPDGHQLMANIDPKHTSRDAQEFLRVNNINWWRTPVEFPNYNPIENLWYELKEYSRHVIKPTTKQQLNWGPTQEQAFAKVKVELTTYTVLALYDPQADT